MESVILLFISKESATYHYTRKQVETACAGVSGRSQVKVIDIAEQPEMAEKYNIEALPTVVIGNRRYVGTATSEVLSSCMGLSSSGPAGAAAAKKPEQKR